MSSRLRVIGRRPISELGDRIDQQGAVEQGAVVVVVAKRTRASCSASG
jgi:hypothetical protein